MANEVIPYYEPGAHITGYATEAITGMRFVAIDGTVDPGWQPEGLKATAIPNVVPIAHTAAVKQFGVAQRDAASGALVTVMRSPGMVVPVVAGAAVVPGVEVEAAADGRAITLAAGVPAGTALSRATAAGQVIAVALA